MGSAAVASPPARCSLWCVPTARFCKQLYAFVVECSIVMFLIHFLFLAHFFRIPTYLYILFFSYIHLDINSSSLLISFDSLHSTDADLVDVTTPNPPESISEGDLKWLKSMILSLYLEKVILLLNNESFIYYNLNLNINNAHI